jgi:hypothetical protein
MGLFGGALIMALLAMVLPEPNADLRPGGAADGPLFMPGEGTIEVVSRSGLSLLVSLTGDGSAPFRAGDRVALPVHADRAAAARRMAVPTSMRWRHPLAGLPGAHVVVAAEVGEHGPPRAPRVWTTLEADHGALPVLSIVAPDAAFFDADSGLLVVGHAMLQATPEQERTYARDPKFWKYPGNYHGRGREWERRALLQFLDASGNERWQTAARLRINGQMTRGFSQHALRVLFDAPLQDSLWGMGSAGATSLVVRAAGNDQVKAMMRDVFQHRLCVPLPFEVSKGVPCVVYLNGAYWGVHHLRQRLDDEELARRWNVRAKDITIVEDLGVLYRGDEAAPEELLGLLNVVAGWDGMDTTVYRGVEQHVDVDEFLAYMAAQLVLGNMDWPRQNVKFWRYEGPVQKGTDLDGRWHMAMGDSDLGFGSIAPASADMFQRVRPQDAPASRLFMGLMRSPLLLQRFKTIVKDLVDGPLSPDRCLHELEAMQRLLAPEMMRHTARWRKPTDQVGWNSEVEVMRTFARERRHAVLAQLERFNGR